MAGAPAALTATTRQELARRPAGDGAIAPVFLGFILVLANRRSVLGDAANSKRFRIVATVCVAGVAAMAVLFLTQTVGGWIGGP